jgi:hypothetical protein
MKKRLSTPELSFKHVERNNCSYFGCCKQLTLQESLQGKRCINHPIKSNDITKNIQFPIKYKNEEKKQNNSNE